MQDNQITNLAAALNLKNHVVDSTTGSEEPLFSPSPYASSDCAQAPAVPPLFSESLTRAVLLSHQQKINKLAAAVINSGNKYNKRLSSPETRTMPTPPTTLSSSVISEEVIGSKKDVCGALESNHDTNAGVRRSHLAVHSSSSSPAMPNLSSEELARRTTSQRARQHNPTNTASATSDYISGSSQQFLTNVARHHQIDQSLVSLALRAANQQASSNNLLTLAARGPSATAGVPSVASVAAATSFDRAPVIPARGLFSNQREMAREIVRGGLAAGSDGAARNVITGMLDSSNHTMDTAKISCSPAASDDVEIAAEDLKETDVICGRGGRTNNWIGNQRYRQIISNTRKNYHGASSNKYRKTALSEAVVEIVLGYGGRFLKQDPSTGKYHEMNVKEARKKAAQALRDKKQHYED